jgi:hypothetical protein
MSSPGLGDGSGEIIRLGIHPDYVVAEGLLLP